ncbi:MAG TPA: hypothetical protein VE597_04735, partial [Geminicoccaceae bacterium]|nr:hypothetical protein [Geminicoccaceae bacterium]
MTAILFAKDDATNGDTPAPKRGRAANSRTAEAKADRDHGASIRAPDRAIKRAVDFAGFARGQLRLDPSPRCPGRRMVGAGKASSGSGAAAERGS